jgi:hypothetical protein
MEQGNQFVLNVGSGGSYAPGGRYLPIVGGQQRRSVSVVVVQHPPGQEWGGALIGHGERPGTRYSRGIVR